MGRRPLALAVLVVGLALRAYLAFVARPLATFDSEKRYEPMAHNLAAGHGFSSSVAPPYLANGFDQPGYPLFLSVFGGNRRLVVIAQVLVEILTVVLMARFARLVPLGGAARAVVLSLALLSPIVPVFALHIWTEMLATALVTAAACAWLAALRDGRRRFYAAAGAASGASLLVRADLVPAVALVGLVGAAFSWRRPGRIALAALVASGLLGVWAVRNVVVLGRAQPFGSGPDQLQDPYVQWLGTWTVRQDDESTAWHHKDTVVFSPEKIGDAEDCARAQAALGTPDGPRIFTELTAKARRARPLRTFVVVPLRRLANVWVHLPAEIGPNLGGTVAAIGWPAILALALVGFVCGLRRRLDAALLLGAVVVGRSILPLAIGIACEPRYAVEAVPACYLLAGLAVQAWLGRGD